MSAFDRFIDDLVNDRDSVDDFPKNESSWEELFDFGSRCLDEIVTLGRKVAQQSVQLTALRRGLAVSIFINVILLAVVLFSICRH